LSNWMPMLQSIQACRALAALLVVHVHATVMARTYSERYGSLDALSNAFYNTPSIGQLGVDLFFVISGFIMIFVTHSLPSSRASVRSFLERRIARIVPLYWFFTFLLAALIALAPGVVVHGELSGTYLLKSLLFVPVLRTDGELMPVLPPGWTLSFEMFFYLCLALLLFLPARYRVWLISLGFLSLVGVGFAFPADQKQPILRVLTSPLLLEFLYGCWISTLVLAGRIPGPGLSSLCVAAGILGFVAAFFLPLQPVRHFSWGIPSALLIYGLVCLERNNSLRMPRFLLRIGDASYSLYLAHWFVLPPVGRAWAKSGLGHRLPGDLLVVLGIFASVGAALAIHRYLEDPLIRLARQLLLPQPSPQSLRAAAQRPRWG
jgi:peptidoglycan/LPS O-acetylase OafA/YrhL